jgi:hypothetical protein
VKRGERGGGPGRACVDKRPPVPDIALTREASSATASAEPLPLLAPGPPMGLRVNPSLMVAFTVCSA